MTFDDIGDGSAGILHPAMVPAVACLVASRLLLSRIRRELAMLTSEAGASLYPNAERMAKGGIAYSLFVVMVAFNLISLGILPGTFI
jgi:hypothetical protein